MSYKVRCADHDTRIDTSRKHNDRHFTFQMYLKNANVKVDEFNELQDWTNNNNIFNYGKLTGDQLKELTSSFSTVLKKLL